MSRIRHPGAPFAILPTFDRKLGRSVEEDHGVLIMRICGTKLGCLLLAATFCQLSNAQIGGTGGGATGASSFGIPSTSSTGNTGFGTTSSFGNTSNSTGSSSLTGTGTSSIGTT